MSLTLGNDTKVPSMASPPHLPSNHHNDIREASSSRTESKQNKKLFRLLTVVAYVIAVSLAAMISSSYYIFLWEPQIKYSAVIKKGNMIFAQDNSSSLSTLIIEDEDPQEPFEGAATVAVPLDYGEPTERQSSVFNYESLPTLNEKDMIENDISFIVKSPTLAYGSTRHFPKATHPKGTRGYEKNERSSHDGEEHRKTLRHSQKFNHQFSNDHFQNEIQNEPKSRDKDQ